jgi:hypothetical protein
MKWLLALALAFLPIAADATTSVGNGGGYTINRYYASTGSGSNVTISTANTYNPMTCNTGAVNCSGGTLSFTVGSSIGTNSKWLVTVFITGSVAQQTSETLNLCVATSSVSGQALEATWSQGGSICNNGLTNRAAGSGSFGNNALAGPNLSAIGELKFIISNNASFSMTCNGAGSTTTVITYYGTCTAIAEPY